MGNSETMDIMPYIASKETTLWDRLKKYFTGNQKVIVTGLAMMNSSYSAACRMLLS